MACKPNEVAILKATTVNLNDDTLMLLTFMYHTASKEAKQNGDKSFYRYEGRVITKDSLQKEIDDLKSDAKRLLPWKWPTTNKTWNPDWFLGYDCDNTNGKAAKWYSFRIKKAMKWDDFLKCAKEGIKLTAKGPKTYPSARYDLDEYVADDGTKFNIDSPETMLKLVGQTFSKQVILKRDLPSN